MSLNVNLLFIAGHLTRDPQIKHSQKGTTIAEIALAIDREWTDESGEKKQNVTFLDLTCFARTGEICERFLTKGDPALFEGRLTVDQWQDRNTGQMQSKMASLGIGFKCSGASQRARIPAQALPLQNETAIWISSQMIFSSAPTSTARSRDHVYRGVQSCELFTISFTVATISRDRF
jgi:single-stranded DNA-binding protein